MDYFKGNRLLRALSPRDRNLLLPALSAVDLDRGYVLETFRTSN